MCDNKHRDRWNDIYDNHEKMQLKQRQKSNDITSIVISRGYTPFRSIRKPIMHITTVSGKEE